MIVTLSLQPAYEEPIGRQGSTDSSDYLKPVPLPTAGSESDYVKPVPLPPAGKLHFCWAIWGF